ncbi:LysR substrate-binding domain-containing protein [Terrabacter sp. NPDC080008]|uniref:LysR substrate-binding domain-containing protein n=1 Tax=Terrabacter sp. NPDC080008 TaxID=3155176 RepID=UPI003450FF99
MTQPFRVEFVPGVTPDKWLRTWAARFPESAVDAVPVEQEEATAHLRDRSASMVLLRLPIDRNGLHVIPLYEEVPVVVAAKESVIAAFEEVDVADLAEEVLVQDPAHVPEWAGVATAEALDRSRAMPAMTTRQAISVVAAGSGVLVVPMSVARLHHRKDVVHRPVTGVAPSGVGLAWRVDDDDPRIEDFIGIVRGRTERSSRGAGQATEDARESRGPGEPGGRHTSSEGRRQERGRALPQRGAAPRRRGAGPARSRRKGRR